ncbi:MAG TPA: alkaline phosphatase family protein [Acidimicrobiales bacterium]|nr:alkaline phosphatase family protein [Acidimicrobiales bacterium]
MDRRRFLKASAAAVALGSSYSWRSAAAALKPTALPASGVGAPFDHVVVLMMENRSFDHLLGWLPGSNGRQAGLTYADTKGDIYPTYELAPDFQGCSYDDPDHSFAGGLTQYNRGQGGGFLKTAAPGDTFPIGYYAEHSRPVLSALARNYTVCDNYFCSVLGQTFPNRVYMMAARTDRDQNTFNQSTLPTIFDRVLGAGLEAREYFHDLPTTGLWGAKFATHLRPFAQFAVDAALGDLPAYTFISPEAVGEGQGITNDDHPHADLRAGDELFSTVYHALRNGPKWNKTVFVINYDEWGGFYDHVIPPRATADNSVVPGSKYDFHLRGFRVPCVVISPFAPARVSHAGPFDHASVLKMVEWRFGLPPLAARDAAAVNLAEALDLTSPPRTDNPTIPTVLGAPRLACTPLSTAGSRPKPIGSTVTTAVPPTTPPKSGVAAGQLARTGLDLPLLEVGGGLLLGAWGAYHLKRTGDTGPLPLLPEPEPPEGA